jgi:uncharacterized membrane protein (Fun14 family)
MEEAERQPSTRWRRRLVLILIVVTAGSIWARSATAKEQGRQETPEGMATQLVATEPGQKEEEPKSGMEKVLPFITEAGIAMLIGIMLGLATRTVAKVLAVIFVVVFLGTQFLAYKGIMTVDWGGFAGWLHQSVLNVSSAESFQEIVTQKLPAAGALLIGYFLGLKKS